MVSKDTLTLHLWEIKAELKDNLWDPTDPGNGIGKMMVNSFRVML